MAASAGTRAPDSNRLDMAAYDTSGIDPGHALAGLCGSWGRRINPGSDRESSIFGVWAAPGGRPDIEN